MGHDLRGFDVLCDQNKLCNSPLYCLGRFVCSLTKFSCILGNLQELVRFVSCFLGNLESYVNGFLCHQASLSSALLPPSNTRLLSRFRLAMKIKTKYRPKAGTLHDVETAATAGTSTEEEEKATNEKRTIRGVGNGSEVEEPQVSSLRCRYGGSF